MTFWSGRACADRSAYTGDAAAGHAADAWQRSASLLLCLFHLRHHRSPAMGRIAAQSLLSRSPAKRLCYRVGSSVGTGADSTGERGKCPANRGTNRAKVAFCSGTFFAPALNIIGIKRSSVLFVTILCTKNWQNLLLPESCSQQEIHENVFAARVLSARDLAVWDYNASQIP